MATVNLGDQIETITARNFDFVFFVVEFGSKFHKL
jgi:hypothetical protein